MSASQRPTILTIFVILTLVNCGLSLLFALVPDSVFNGLGDAPSPPRDTAFQIADVVLALAKIGGAVLLLRMKKMGFYIYTLAEVGVVGLLLYTTFTTLDYYENMIFDANLTMDPSVFIILTAAVLIISSIVWIGVYASQLKNLD